MKHIYIVEFYSKSGTLWYTEVYSSLKFAKIATDLANPSLEYTIKKTKVIR